MAILTHSDNEQETICTDCFNKEMADYYGIEDFKDYIKTYTAINSDGVSHVFEINKRIMGTGVFWQATEVNDGNNKGYQFEIQADMDGNQHEAIQKLYSKIHKGLSKKSIKVKSYGSQKLCSIINDEIEGRIEWDSGEDGVALVIDGNKYSLQEFGEILRSREGFNFKLKIYDPTEDME